MSTIVREDDHAEESERAVVKPSARQSEQGVTPDELHQLAEELRATEERIERLSEPSGLLGRVFGLVTSTS